MTISTQDSKVNYQGNGQTTVFQIPFPFLENNQIYVQKKDAEGNLINYTYATDYTVTGAGEENGGSVTLNVAPEQGSTISIYRDVPLTQEVDYRENEIFPAETHEEALDKLTMEVQQLQEQLDRSIKVDRFSDVDLDIFVNEIERVYDSTDNIDIVANNINDVNTVSGNIANVNTAVTNMAAIQDAPNQAISAQNSATQASQYAQKAEDKADEASESARLAVSALSLQIGDIGFAPLGIDESLNLRRYLNGQVIIQSQFAAFTNKVKSAIALYPNLATTEANWQAEKTNSKLGQCGKFVIDDTAGTIRLPCVVNTQGLVDLALIGGIKNESLPNIEGSCNFFGGAISDSKSVIGSFKISATGKTGTNIPAGSTSGTTYKLALEAPSSYQDNAPVQQEAVQYPYYIQVATGVEETLPAIRDYEINTPFFFGQSMYSDVAPDNASWLASNGQWNAKTVYPDYYDWLLEQMNNGVSGFVASTAAYTDYDFVINTKNQTFRLPLLNGEEDLPGNTFENISYGGHGSSYTAPKNGSYTIWGYGATNFLFLNNSTSGERITTQGNTSSSSPGGCTIKVKKGDVVIAGYYEGTVSYFVFTPAVGNGSLYYYVGDTVQDASLINAGVVLGQLSDKISRTATSDKELVVGWGMPDYSAGVSIPFTTTMTTTGQSQTMPFDGDFSFSWLAGNVITTLYFFVNNVNVEKRGNASTSMGVWNSVKIRVAKGDVVNIKSETNYTASEIISTLFPCKGAK